MEYRFIKNMDTGWVELVRVYKALGETFPHDQAEEFTKAVLKAKVLPVIQITGHTGEASNPISRRTRKKNEGL